MGGMGRGQGKKDMYLHVVQVTNCMKIKHLNINVINFTILNKCASSRKWNENVNETVHITHKPFNLYGVSS